MAWGQYVKTYAGALSKSGAQIAAGILSSGGSVQQAAAALTTYFPSLSGSLAALLAINTSRGVYGSAAELTGTAPPPLGGVGTTPVANLPVAIRYLVIATYTDPATGRQVKDAHWIDSPTGEPMSFTALRDVMLERQSLVMSRSVQLYPVGEEADVDTEQAPIITLARTQVRA